MNSMLAWLPLVAPLSLFAVAATTRHVDPHPRRTLRAAGLATGLGLGVALLGAASVLSAGSRTSPVLGVGDVGLSLRLDLLSVTMFGLVSFVGLLVVRYSRHYLEGDPRQAAFVGSLCLALGAVSLLVLAGNLTQLVVAWVAASFALHRLLVFFKERPRAVVAGRKKMIAARVGDVCLLTGAVLLAQAFGSSDIATIADRARSLGELPAGAGLAVWLLVAAAVLKSAQFPFHAWLPEVMETPTPVSALLHAGMINSGGFLVLRFADVLVLEPSAMTALLAIGACSAVFGSLVWLTQTTVKGSLAYSTLSQMGFMMFEIGLGAFSVAILHIVAHSLYKAHAFLSAGSAVIAAPSTAQSMRRIPAAFGLGAGWVVAVGSCALFLDASDPAWSATVGLASVLAFGVAMWAAKQLEDRRPASWAAAGAIAVATPLLFLALKGGVGLVFGSELPQTPAPTAVANGILLVTLSAFAAIAWAQLVGFPTGPFARRAWVLVRGGAYVGALWDRATGATRVRSQRGSDDRGSAEPSSRTWAPGPSGPERKDDRPAPEVIAACVAQAAKVVPPLWPLSDFVAVNPFLGLADRSFEEASAWLERTAGARTVMPRSFYAAAIDRGEITREDLRAALNHRPLGMRLDALERGARRRDRELVAAPTVADVARGITGLDVPRLVVESIGDWASAHFDRGQAKWPSPWKHASPYAAWRGHAALDHGPEILGLGDLRSVAAALPESAPEAISACVDRLGLGAEELDLYFQRLLLRVDGWAGHLRYRGWSCELAGEPPTGLDELLAISLAWEAALVANDPRVASAWRIAKHELAAGPAPDPEREIDLALHRAFEIASERQLAERLPGEEPPPPVETAAQVVFCIDVRSERMRRSLEACAPDVRTLGFAGFFGMAIEWVPLGEERGAACCPVLLKPAHVVREDCAGADEIVSRQRFRRAVLRAWSAFKNAPVSAFGFVETMGLGYGVRLVADSVRRTPGARGGETRFAGAGPDLAVGRSAGRTVGMALEERVATAEAALRAMSLTHGFAPLVVLTAHGSTTVNNPYASGLDCGACGGRSGEPNARVASAILNDPDVRAALRPRGIEIPGETRFLAAVHDTTTDVVRVCDAAAVPPTHRQDLERLEVALAEAGRLARRERAPLLGIHHAVEQRIPSRAADWSQVRPEWGLAGCTSFIAAPRRHTAGAKLGSSAFLHEYVWQKDCEFRVLEQIMTAPLVVATWINLQYFASTVDNRAFGAGDKVLHNVAAGLGVVEGNGGDLRVGLPLQSIHDGSTFFHRPCRLTAAIAAPPDAMTKVIERSPVLRDLLDHDWIHLVALNDRGRISHRYVGASQWSERCPDEAEEVAA